MIPYILAAIGGYLIGQSRKDEQFADGGSIKGQTDEELYDALVDMGFDYGEFGSDNFDDSGFSEMAINLGYRWDNNKKLWFSKEYAKGGEISDKKIVDFVKSLEESKIITKDAHKNPQVIKVVRDIVSMSRKEFDSYIKKNPSQNVMMIYSEFQDWKQTYDDGGMTKPRYEIIQDTDGVFVQGFWVVINTNSNTLIDIFEFKKEAQGYVSELKEKSIENVDASKYNGQKENYMAKSKLYPLDSAVL